MQVDRGTHIIRMLGIVGCWAFQKYLFSSKSATILGMQVVGLHATLLFEAVKFWKRSLLDSRLGEAFTSVAVLAQALCFVAALALARASSWSSLALRGASCAGLRRRDPPMTAGYVDLILPSGEHASLAAQTFKCWQLSSGEVVWDALTVLTHLLPQVHAHTRNFRVNKTMDKRHRFKELCARMGVQEEAHFHRGLQSLHRRAKAEEATEADRERPTISTWGFILLCLAEAVGMGCGTAQRRAASALLSALLAAVLPGLGIADVPLEEVLPAASSCGDAGAGDCDHVAEARCIFGDARPGADFAADLLRVLDGGHHCSAVLRLLRDVIQSITEAVENEWSGRGFHTDAIRYAEVPEGSKRNRAIDHDLKDAFVQRAKKKRFSAQVVASTARGLELTRLNTERLPAYIHCASAHWAANADLSLSVAADAGNFGHPLEETVMYAFSDGEKGSWGAPMARRGDHRVSAREFHGL